MGVESKKPLPLPAPTETDTTTPSELDTELAKPGDEKSSYSIPEDGTPVTIRTRGHKASKSQTSLLIEYFEGGKNGPAQDRKPSVRVRLTPSKKSKGDRIQVTETKGARKASLSRRIPLEQAIASREIELHEGDDTNSMTSYASATEESNVSRNPIDIDIDRRHRRRRPASPLIPSTDSYQPGNPSEISAIPTDSFLDGNAPGGDLKRSASLSRGESMVGAASTAALATAAAAMSEGGNSKTRTKERAHASRDKSDKKRASRSRTSGLSEPAEDDIRSSRRRSSRGHQESNVSAVDSSVVSSHAAPSHRSLDTTSVRSGASKSSINNPKLLETVEDAIRRLILPELNLLKREQSKRESRRGSITSSATSASRDDLSLDRRRLSGHRGERSRDGSQRKERRNREARHEFDDQRSLRSPSRDSVSGEYHSHEGETTTPKRSHNLLKAAASTVAGTALAGGAVARNSSSGMSDEAELSEKKQRDKRRRRTENSKPRNVEKDMLNDDDEHEDDVAPTPPMPLMSDINPSELTRTSILSAESERPNSASEEFEGSGSVRDVFHRDMVGSDSLERIHVKSPISHEKHAMAMHHANVSHGDLTALPRGTREITEEYETDEFGRKVPAGSDNEFDRHREPPEDLQDDFEERYFSTQDVPPPLRYVPYQAGARGLSPIPSVSGYTEGGSEAPLPQNSTDVPSPSKSPERARLPTSSHHGDSVSRDSGDLDRYPLNETGSFDETASRQAVKGVGANPNLVHTPVGVESAVASLVDGSVLDQSVVTESSAHDYNAGRDSSVPYNDHSTNQSSREGLRTNTDDRQELEERQPTTGSKSALQLQEHSEYELDECGQKVLREKYRQSPTASEAAITAGAVGAAAAALKAAKERRQTSAASRSAEDYQPAGVARNRSFKERTMRHGWEPRNTPSHSTDRLDFEDQPRLGASGLPDMNDPMPEVGYVDELRTNPSPIEERLEGDYDPRSLSGRATPTQRNPGVYEQLGSGDESASGGLEVTEAVGAAALGATAGMATARNLQHDKDEDEWHRTSDERKRDTLVTNPYEDTSPIANPELGDNLLGAHGLDPGFDAGSPALGQKYDEGYMSNGPNRTPDIQQSEGKGMDFSQPATGDDPFYTPKKHARHLSGMSQGMVSPLYDAATGAGIERIENKDIVALMQHLMVRDAQRSARDTEILALVMNATVEMRTYFREVKELVQDTGDDVIFANVENTEKLQRAINGPRPFPDAVSRSLNSQSQAGMLDDAGFKKKNLWRRALQGLSARGTNDLSRIEDILMQLLGDVNTLKTQTAPPVSTSGGLGRPLGKPEFDEQYEREGEFERTGSSTPIRPSRNKAASTSQSREQSHRGGYAERDVAEHRISMPLQNEDKVQYRGVDAGMGTVKTGGDYLETPDRAEQIERGSSAPLETPPRLAPGAEQQPLSAENTPRTAKGKKTKVSSGGWLPKLSRWSGTTSSSVGKALRGNGTSKKVSKYDGSRPPSQSTSSLASYDEDGYYSHDVLGESKVPTGFSDPSLTRASVEHVAQGSSSTHAQHMTPEDPKYKAHRNSLNLQHPQPRPGQTERFRTALESSAQEYSNPMTPRSAEWAGSATSINRLPPNAMRFCHDSSVPGPETDLYASAGEQKSGPPRPPKEPLESPSSQTSPPKPSRASRVQKEGYITAHQISEGGRGPVSGAGASHFSGSSPKLENRTLIAARAAPSRRPSGPRAMTPKSPGEQAAREERRRKRDTFGTIASDDTNTF